MKGSQEEVKDKEGVQVGCRLPLSRGIVVDGEPQKIRVVGQ